MREYKFEFARYGMSSKRKGIYDLLENDQFPFSFIKITRPISDYLIQNNAQHVIQSWSSVDKSNKALHSGLILVGSDFFYGNNLNSKGKLDFIIVRFIHSKNQMLVWLFRNKKPRNKTRFTRGFIKHLIRTNGVFH